MNVKNNKARIIYPCDRKQLFTLSSSNKIGQCSWWKGDSNIRCCYRRTHLFNYCSFRTYLILLFIFLCIFAYNYHYSCLLIQSRQSSKFHVRIMYVVRTASKYHSTRLIYLLKTWIPLVQEDVFFVSDILIPNITRSHIIATKSICGNTSHSVRSLCCQTIHNFVLYRRYLSRYDWFCHFDDDQYVHVNNLREYLSTLNPNRPYYIGRNSWNTTVKRKKNPHPRHFWFATLGAGVCISKRTLHLLKPYTQTILQFVNGCMKQYYPDDIYLGFLIENHLNVSLTKNHRFHSHLERSLFDDKYTFMNTFHQQITFGFQRPRTVPKFLPNLFSIANDPFRMRTLHCFLYIQLKDCQIRLSNYLVNTTK